MTDLKPPPTRPDADPLDPGFLRDLVTGSIRLTPEQSMRIYREMPIQELGRWADARCRMIHGDQLRTYVIDRNINYTNVCTAKCTFCAFRRDGTEDDAYTLEFEEILQKIRELVDIGGTQILMQGGMNPELPLEWYEELLGRIRDAFPRSMSMPSVRRNDRVRRFLRSAGIDAGRQASLGTHQTQGGWTPYGPRRWRRDFLMPCDERSVLANAMRRHG